MASMYKWNAGLWSFLEFLFNYVFIHCCYEIRNFISIKENYIYAKTQSGLAKTQSGLAIFVSASVLN